MAEASGSRTHHRRRKTTTAGFEDRDDHRTICASALLVYVSRRNAGWLAGDNHLVPETALGEVERKNTVCDGRVHEAGVPEQVADVAIEM